MDFVEVFVVVLVAGLAAVVVAGFAAGLDAVFFGVFDAVVVVLTGAAAGGGLG